MSTSPDDKKGQRELEEQRLADVGEASAVFLHELGNVLNNVLLNSKMLLLEAPPETHARLQETCRLIESTSWRMRELSDLRSAKRASAGPVDLNEVIKGTMRESREVVFSLADNLPAISVREVDVARLVRLIIENSRLAQSEGDAPVRVATSHAQGRVVLTVTDHGQQLNAENRTYPFNPFAPPRPGQSGLELAICKNLARQMDALIQAENWEKGVRVIVSWPSLATV